MKKYIYILLISVSFVNCRHSSDMVSPVNTTTGDVLVKSIYRKEFAGPRFFSHFEMFDYDSAGRPTNFYYSDTILPDNPTSNIIQSKLYYSSNRVEKVKVTVNNLDYPLPYETGNELIFSYDHYGRVNKIDYYDMRNIIYLSDSVLYDSLGRLRMTYASKIEQSSIYRYDLSGDLSSIAIDNGINDKTSTRHYSIDFRPYSSVILNPTYSINYVLRFAIHRLFFAKGSPQILNYLPCNLSQKLYAQAHWQTSKWYYQYPQVTTASPESYLFKFEYITKPK